MKTRLLALAFGFVVGCACAYAAHQHKLENEMVEQVQGGKLVLTCLMKDGERVIAGDMVTGYFDGSWQFKNGYAKSCEVTKNEAFNL